MLQIKVYLVGWRGLNSPGSDTGNISLVVPYVDAIAQTMTWGSPIINFILVVGVECTRIENERLSGAHVSGGVLVPQIALYKTRVDASAFTLQGAE